MTKQEDGKDERMRTEQAFVILRHPLEAGNSQTFADLPQSTLALIRIFSHQGQIWYGNRQFFIFAMTEVSSSLNSSSISQLFQRSNQALLRSA